MRQWYVPLVALLLGGAWFASPRTAAQDKPQLATAGVAIGERVTLFIEREGASVHCQVIDVRDQFLGCAAEKGNDGAGRESRYNLRFVTRIDKATK